MKRLLAVACLFTSCAALAAQDAPPAEDYHFGQKLDIKRVVQAPDARLQRGLDGLMRNTDPQQPFAQVQGKALDSGMLESSNVDAAGALVQMIQLQRQFEMQVKVIKHGDENARSANTLLRLNG